MSKVRILVRRAWRFVKPVGGVMTKPKGTETADEAATRVAHDNAERIRRASHHNEDHYFDAKPGDVLEAPAWVKDTEEWKMGTADGTIEELVARSVAGRDPKNASLANEKTVETSKEEAEEEEAEEESEEEPEEEKEEEQTQNTDGNVGAPPGATRRLVVGNKTKKKKKAS